MNQETGLDKFADAIQDVEGYFPGSVAYRNNNPGNLIFTSYYQKNFGALPGDPPKFSRFPDYETGRAALKHQIELDAARGLTIEQMMAKYAPAQDGNDPDSYAAIIAGKLGTSVNARVSEVLA